MNLKPSTIKYSILLILLSVCITITLTATSILWGVPEKISAMDSISSLITAVVLIVCAWNINARKSWPRWLLLVLFAFGSLTIPLILLVGQNVFKTIPAYTMATGAAQYIIQVIALVLLFAKSSEKWLNFKSQ